MPRIYLRIFPSENFIIVTLPAPFKKSLRFQKFNFPKKRVFQLFEIEMNKSKFISRLEKPATLDFSGNNKIFAVDCRKSFTMQKFKA
jgi:hypothetical protein